MNDVYRVAADGGTPMAVSGDRYANEFFSAVVARRPDARDVGARHRVGAVVAARPQPSRRSGDLAARPDRGRRAGGVACAHQRRREGSVADVGRATARRSTSCPIAAAPRTSGSTLAATAPGHRRRRQVTRVHGRPRAVAVDHRRAATRSCSSATSGSGSSTRRRGKRRKCRSRGWARRRGRPSSTCGSPTSSRIWRCRPTARRSRSRRAARSSPRRPRTAATRRA